MKKRTLLEWGLILPVIGVALIMVRSEIKLQQGQVYRIEVEGYDPRDLLHGHYLSIRYNLKPNGVRARDTDRDDDEYCFSRDGQYVHIHRRAGGHMDGSSCNSVTPVKNLSGAKRYLVPEVDARTLEKALRNQKASVDLIIQANGDTSMGMLYLDGIPWRETLEK